MLNDGGRSAWGRRGAQWWWEGRLGEEGCSVMVGEAPGGGGGGDEGGRVLSDGRRGAWGRRGRR